MPTQICPLDAGAHDIFDYNVTHLEIQKSFCVVQRVNII